MKKRYKTILTIFLLLILIGTSIYLYTLFNGGDEKFVLINFLKHDGLKTLIIVFSVTLILLILSKLTGIRFSR